MSDLSAAGWNLSEVAWSGGNKQLCEQGAEILDRSTPLTCSATTDVESSIKHLML